MTQSSDNYGLLTLLYLVMLKTVRAIENEIKLEPFLNDNL